jgi:hypothetical protein
MASRSLKATYQHQEPRKGGMPLFGNRDVTWDVFTDGRELLAVTDPYEFPTFYHVGRREDGTWHVLSVEERDYPLDPWEDQAELERQLARVRSLRRVTPHDDGWGEAFRAMDLYVHIESPDARARGEGRGRRIREEVIRELAEAKGSRPRKQAAQPHERQARRRGPFGGLFLTLGGDR